MITSADLDPLLLLKTKDLSEEVFKTLTGYLDQVVFEGGKHPRSVMETQLFLWEAIVVWDEFVERHPEVTDLKKGQFQVLYKKLVKSQLPQTPPVFRAACENFLFV